jgi:superfamily II DNA or RNA helicase/rRNA pseudouridine-1189 N-methylase Emg1 (Nep1/Mra1 family)
MREQDIQDLIASQRPYYHLQGTPIRGIDNQYWLVFKHQDADSLLKNVIRFLGFRNQDTTHKIIRIDECTGYIITYAPKKPGDIPSFAILRTGAISLITQFLQEVEREKDKSLLSNNFRGITDIKGHYNLPEDQAEYQSIINQLLQRSTIYRRATAYFDSGLFKFYEDPLQEFLRSNGRIQLLMDWRGFTKEKDIIALEQLYDISNPTQFIQRTLQEFLAGLEESSFSGTEILAELIRLGFLEIKLVKMEGGRGIYHSKTGIFSDIKDNHALHSGSNNFTVAAHSCNFESCLFLRSWASEGDRSSILEFIQEFDEEWTKPNFAYDLNQEFLKEVLAEKQRRSQAQQPQIDSITPDILTPGLNTVSIIGDNLDQVTDLQASNDHLVDITITSQTPQQIEADINVDPDHPPQPIKNFVVKTTTGIYVIRSPQPPVVQTTLEIPEFPEISGFKKAVEIILSGQHGQPQDFLYWLAQQRPQQFRIEQSSDLEELTNQGVLFEHQKSGAQQCLQIMQDFGVAVCADAVGLGKTRLAAAVARLYHQINPKANISIIAAQKLHDNWKREMTELNFNDRDYELYNKNLMSRKGNGFINDFSRYGGGDLVIIDEAHEGIRNHTNRIHRTCLEIQERDQQSGKQRHYLLLTATPWNNRRDDIYNILKPFLSHPEAFKELGFPAEIVQWFENRDVGLRNFTDNTDVFRRVYGKLFLQRTRQMLRLATPDLDVYASRQASWLPVNFEEKTEQALDKIFSQFEENLFIPFSDPVRYFTGSGEQRGLLQNQRRFFLQRAESSMYALARTITNFRIKIELMQEELNCCSPDPAGLLEFLLRHYKLSSTSSNKSNRESSDQLEMWDEEEIEDDESETEQKVEKRQKLRTQIEQAIERLKDNEAKRIYCLLLEYCDSDLKQLDEIQKLLTTEFIKDHKREQVTQKVRELTAQGHKVLLISTFSDTVIDYFSYMTKDKDIAEAGIGLAIGATKEYHSDDGVITFAPHRSYKGQTCNTTLKRQELFRLFAPIATCRKPIDRPPSNQELMVLIGSETLSVGQNLQDANYLINIDLPWNPMILEQRIGRIDRPKHQPTKYIHIFYANSESQLLRQASRLQNLNRKLVGDLAQPNDEIHEFTSVGNLGASVYGDTLFDDSILPGYVDFIQSLVQARDLQQESFQEEAAQKLDVAQNLYTQQELLYSSDIQRLIAKLGDNYQANPITMGHITNDAESRGLLALTLQYFDPNHKLIPDQQRKVFWNDLTSEQDGYGNSIAMAIRTTGLNQTISSEQTLAHLTSIYQELIQFKRGLEAGLGVSNPVDRLSVKSERLNKISNRISTELESFPPGITKPQISKAIGNLDSWKESKAVQKILRDYAEGDQSKLPIDEYVTTLVNDTTNLGLLPMEKAQAVSLRLSLDAILLRIDSLNEK